MTQNNKIFQKSLLTMGLWVIVLIPTYLAVLFWNLLDPVGFVERLLFIILCLITLGWVQFFTFFFGVMITIFIFDEWGEL